MRPEMPATASPVKATSRARARVLSAPGLRIKQLVLGIGAVYFTFVAVTNVVNFIVSVGGYHWSFLNSGNVSYIASITKGYSWPTWFDKAAVLAASLVEAAGAWLFWKALRNFRGHGTGVRDAWIALGWKHPGLARLYRRHRVLRRLSVRRPVPGTAGHLLAHGHRHRGRP